MALPFRRSMKALLRLSMRVLEGEKTALNSPNSLFGGLCKVGLGDFKYGPKRKAVCLFEENAVNFRRFSSNVTLKSEKDEEFKEWDGRSQQKRKKLTGKRAVIKWLKHFRWQKKKEFEQMSPEEKILYKLKKARRKKDRLVAALQKLEPKESSDPTHDPEILTPEEHFYYLKMGHKCKNYVPVGRRGIFGGVILNMHLHWKKHQTVKVIVKTFTPDEVRDIAAELARLTGGIVLDIHEGNTIIMYRGRNYSQPPPEIMTPKITLSKNKALAKSKYREALRAVRVFILRLENELEVLHKQMEGESQTNTEHNEKMSNDQRGVTKHVLQGRLPVTRHISKHGEAALGHIRVTEELSEYCGTETDHLSDTDVDMDSDSESLSDLFETDSEMNSESSAEPDHCLYVDTIDAAPVEDSKVLEDFAKGQSELPKVMKKLDGLGDDPSLPEFDEVDKLFLRASSLLKRRK